MHEFARPRLTLLSPEEAEAIHLRDGSARSRSRSNRSHSRNGSRRGVSNNAHLGLTLGQIPTHGAAKSAASKERLRASYALRPSMTLYKERESCDDTIVSSLGIDNSGHGSVVLQSRRFSVSPDLGNAFEDMFDTDWEGYLWKQGHVVRNWRYRFAVLSGTTLSYYISKDVALADSERYRGRVTVTGAKRDEGRSNGVLITTTISKVFAIYTRTVVEAEVWTRMIQQAVAHVNSPKPSLSVASTTVSMSCRDSEFQMRSNFAAQYAAGGTGGLLAQTVRSSTDWKTRNLNTIKQFYALWTTQFEQNDAPSTAATLLSLFPMCSTDMSLSVRYPCEFLPATPFFGREGLVDVVVSLSKIVSFTRFTVTRYLNTSQPNVFEVLASGKIWNKALQREFIFNTRDEVHLSPGGRVNCLQMQIEVDVAAFQLSDSDRKSFRSERTFQATTTKRVLSLSIQHFHVNRILGKGTFGTVVLAERKNTGDIYAVKVLEKSSMSNYDKLRTKTEMRILRDVHHPFIAPLRFAFQSNSRVFLGMEYYPGGSLYTHMNRFSANKEHRIKIPLDLSRVRFYTAQIVLALCHLHACDIVYRDLKPDNIMIDENGNVALVDFGLSKTNVSPLHGARTMAGSPAYTAPELLKPKRSRDYGMAVDWWCLGILVYEMLLAKRPFHHLNVSVLYKLIEKDPVKFPSKCQLPIEARDLILGLLEKDPTKRLGARQASDVLLHPFFKDIRWDYVLKKKYPPPFVPIPLTIDEERARSPDVSFDHYLMSHSAPTNSLFNILFPWRTPHPPRHRRHTERDADTFGKFSYVSDTTNSFLVDEDEMIDAAFTGRRSIQLQALSAEV